MSARAAFTLLGVVWHCIGCVGLPAVTVECAGELRLWLCLNWFAPGASLSEETSLIHGVQAGLCRPRVLLAPAGVAHDGVTAGLRACATVGEPDCSSW